MSNIRCAAWRVTLADGATFVREYATPQPAEVALACVPNVTRAEPVGELVTPKPRRPRPPRPAAATAETTRPPSSHIAPAEIPAEPARWQWPPLLTEITRMHFEGRRR